MFAGYMLGQRAPDLRGKAAVVCSRDLGQVRADGRFDVGVKLDALGCIRVPFHEDYL